MERDPNTCENRTRAAGQGADAPATDGATLQRIDSDARSAGSQGIGAPVLVSPERTLAFTPSTTLGIGTVNRMMASRYVTVVGILGEPESGKTACLVSLYLLVSNGMLDRWTFADSASLMAFEDISRAAREWNAGQPPEQMTLHTEMADDRQPGFLHLRLKRKSDGRRVDLALPDLPGEWTEALIKTSRTDRLEFMKSAETVWLIVDGKALRDPKSRQGVITRLGQLLGRLKAMTSEAPPRARIVVSHRDMGELDKGIRDRLVAEIAKHALPADIIDVAPFADDETVCRSGFGIEALLDASIGNEPDALDFWPSTTPTSSLGSYLGYRRDR